MILDKGDRLIIASFYDGTVPTVKMAITVSLDGNVSLHVHNREVTRSHDIWNYLPRNCSVSQYVQCLIQRIQHYSVCVGNPDEDMSNNKLYFVMNEAIPHLMYSLFTQKLNTQMITISIPM